MFFMIVILIILQSINCDMNSSSMDKNSTNKTIELSFTSTLLSQNLDQNLEKLKKNDSMKTLDSDSYNLIDTTMRSITTIGDLNFDNSSNNVSMNNIIDLSLNKTNLNDVHNVSNSSIEITKLTNSISKNSSDLDSIEIEANEIQSNENQTKVIKTKNNNLDLDNIQNTSTIQIMISSTPIKTINTTEIIKMNQTLLSTILLRMHSIVQYSSNFSNQAIIPYVYLVKIQINDLYRQVADSSFLQIYLSNLFNLIVNDIMNKECNVLSTMANYVVLPAIEARGTSNYFIDRIREFTDHISRWHSALQRWSSHLANTLNQIAELRIEDCGKKLLCSLGKARYQTLREDQPRQLKSKIIQFLNNLFNMPMLEKRLKRNFVEARQFGASGGDCESMNSNCAIPTDDLINLIK